MTAVLACYSDMYVNDECSQFVSLMDLASSPSSGGGSEDWQTGRQHWEVLFLKLIENQRCLQEHFDLNRLQSKGLGWWREGGEEGGTERKREKRGSAVSQSWEQIGLKVTTPSMRWFSTEGNGAWVLSHKKQFIAKPTEVWEIQSLSECQIFSATNCAMSGL